MDFDRLLAAASLVLQKTTGGSAVLSRPVVLKDSRRSLTLRCAVTSAQTGLSSVIVKQIKEEAVRGFSDWASLAFLSELPEADGLVPRFYGGDVPHRFFLIEDLGGGYTLQDLLTGSEPATTSAAVEKLAVVMARLQAVTLGKADRFEEIRAALPANEGLGREWEATNWLEQRSKVADWFKALDCTPPFDFDRGLERISAIYRQPEEFLTFTHGDPAPSNNHFLDGQARLLDFEYGGFRHALYDLTGWNMLCPLPADRVREMSRAFREELTRTCPAARDEARFAKEWAYLCAYRALAMLTWIPPSILKENRLWAENWTMREAVFVSTSRWQQVTAPYPELEAMRVAAELMIQSLRRIWPEFQNEEDVLPQWSALK